MSDIMEFDLAVVLNTLTEQKLEKDAEETAALKEFVAHMFRCKTADVVMDFNFPFLLSSLGEEVTRQHPQLGAIIPPEVVTASSQYAPQRPEDWVRSQERRFGSRIAMQAYPLKAA